MTRQEAINAKCKDCIYDSFSTGTWREQTSNCLDTLCPLYNYRPLSKHKKHELKQERIARMTKEELEAYYDNKEKLKRRLKK